MMADVELSGRVMRSRIYGLERKYDSEVWYSRICTGIGMVGVVAVVIAYSLFSDVTVGISNLPMEVPLMVAVAGVVASVIGFGLSMSFDRDAEDTDRKIRLIERRMSRTL